MSCKNCQGGCIHSKHRDLYHKVEHKDDNGRVFMVESVFDGYEHFCDKNPEEYKAWHEAHKHDTYDEYKSSVLPCYEPTETIRGLQEMLDLTKQILDKLTNK